MAKETQIQKLKSEFQDFKDKTIEILNRLNRYNYETNTLGMERMKSRETQKLINSLKGE